MTDFVSPPLPVENALPEKNRCGKFTGPQMVQICQWFAEKRRAPEVQQLCEAEFNIKPSRQLLHTYRKTYKWGRIIRWLERRYMQQLESIPIAQKTVRVRHLDDIYNRSMMEHVISHSKAGRPVFGVDPDTALKALEQARVEVEGTSPLVAIDQSTSKTLTQYFQQIGEEQCGKRRSPNPSQADQSRINGSQLPSAPS